MSRKNVAPEGPEQGRSGNRNRSRATRRSGESPEAQVGADPRHRYWAAHTRRGFRSPASALLESGRLVRVDPSREVIAGQTDQHRLDGGNKAFSAEGLSHAGPSPERASPTMQREFSIGIAHDSRQRLCPGLWAEGRSLRTSLDPAALPQTCGRAAYRPGYVPATDRPCLTIGGSVREKSSLPLEMAIRSFRRRRPAVLLALPGPECQVCGAFSVAHQGHTYGRNEPAWGPPSNKITKA